MKKILLHLSCLALFLAVFSCQKAGEVLLISAHTWVVTESSNGGQTGDEYRFHDNRLYFHTSGASTADGRWDMPDYNDLTYLEVNSDNTFFYFRINKLTSNELEITPYFQGNPSAKITLSPKQ